MEVLVKHVWFQQNLSPDIFAIAEWRVDREALSSPIQFMAFYIEENLLGVVYRNRRGGWMFEVGLEEPWSDSLSTAMQVSEEDWNDILLLSVENEEAFEELEAERVANPERDENDEDERFNLEDYQWLDDYESLTCAYMRTGYGEYEEIFGYALDDLLEYEEPTSLPITEDQIKGLQYDSFPGEDSMMSYPEG